MTRSSWVSGIKIAAVVLTLSAGRAFAGFTDLSEARGATLKLNENAFASADDQTPVPGFDKTKDKDKPTTPNATKVTLSEPHVTQAPVAAPLPVALLPGGVMIGVSFLATRLFKRRIV